MAIFSNYTNEQKITIEYLINRGKAINRRIEEIDDKDNSTDFPTLWNDLTRIKAELKDALNAKAIFEGHIEEARKHIEEAEAIKEKWGF